MAVYQGRINCRQFAAFVNSKLVAEGFQQISSDIPGDGYVFKSMGKSGQDEWYFRLKDIPGGNYMQVGVYEKYTPNTVPGAGTFSTAGHMGNMITWNTSSSFDRFDVEYVLNVNLDRIILHVQGVRAESNWCSSLIYAGLPKRQDPNDKGPNCALIAGATRTDSSGKPKVMRNRAMTANPTNYIWDWYSNTRSYGWGKQIFFSPLFFGAPEEGVRGELDGLYIMENIDQAYEILHKDTFQKNGKTYMVFSRDKNYDTSEQLPQATYVMEIN